MDAFRYLLSTFRPHRRRLILAVLTWFGTMLVDLGSPLVIAVLIDKIIGQGRYDWLVPLMIGFGVLPFAGAVLNLGRQYLMTLVGQRLVFDIRLDLYNCVQRLSCRYHQHTTTGLLMERLRGDVQQLQSLLTTETPAILVQTLTGLIMIVIMFTFSVPLTLMVLTAIGLYLVNYKWFVRRIRAVQRRYRRKMDQLSGIALERLSGKIIVTACGTQRHEARRFLKRNFLAERLFHRFRMLNLAYGTTSSAIAWLTYLAVTVIGTLMAVYEMLTYGAVTAMAAFTLRLVAPAVKLAELSNTVQQARVALSRIFQLMHAERDVIDSGGQRPAHLHGCVIFQNVTFSYEPNTPVIRQMTLRAEPGQTIALVGRTGCGKSTLASLLYRYYDVQSGAILVDGRDVRDLDPRWYRRRLALVPQDPLIFDTTIAENIAYARPDTSRSRIEKAARSAELGRLIESLPQGLDTCVGQGNLKLSVGEKQRLCIARAILADPAILILDEATSSLDATSETLIQRALKNLMKHRTCFVIAHRLSTIIDADLIVVIDHGQIIEKGRHKELIQSRHSFYRQLVLTQIQHRSVRTKTTPKDFATLPTVDTAP